MRPRTTDSVDRLLAQWRKERPDLDPWPVGIQGRILRVSAHLLRQTEARLAALGLTWEAFSLIVTLRRSGKPYALRPTDLLKESLLTSGAITNRIDRVEQLGLIERINAPRDRRSCTIRLTPSGKRLADNAIAAHFANMEKLLIDLSIGERQALTKALSKLLVRFEHSKVDRLDHTTTGAKRRN